METKIINTLEKFNITTLREILKGLVATSPNKNREETIHQILVSSVICL
jgi:hypothetical protein